MDDRNVSPYLKINELVEQLNAHNRYIADIDALFRTLYVDNSITGWAARAIFRHYVRKNFPPSAKNIRPIDIPPIIPGTLEIDNEEQREGGNGVPAPSGRRDFGRTEEIESFSRMGARSKPRRR